MDSLDDICGCPGASGLVTRKYTEDEINTIYSQLEKIQIFLKNSQNKVITLKR